MSDRESPEGRWVSMVRLGPKSQIVIPKEVRDIFDLSPGDTLLLLADREKGIALVDPAQYRDVMDKILTPDIGHDPSHSSKTDRP